MWRHTSVGVVVLLIVAFGAVPAVAGATALGVAAVQTATAHTDLESAFIGTSLKQMSEPDDCGFLHCFTPQMVQAGYNYGPAYAAVGGYLNAGAGQTIVIFDAFGSPTVASDLATFDSTFGLPSATLNIICPSGCPVLDLTGDSALSFNEIGWTQEIALDTQYAHAMAPAAAIDLVVAHSNSDNDILVAELFALHHHLGNVWTQSFGSPECTFTPGPTNPWFAENNKVYAKAVSEGVTIFASAGDAGAQAGCLTPAANYPASNPNNIAVGGTYLNESFGPASPNGTYAYEDTWNDFENPNLIAHSTVFGVGGGAPSRYFATPWWQAGHTVTPFQCSGSPVVCVKKAPHFFLGKVAADVAYDAGVDGGVIGYWSAAPLVATPGFYIFGGTSAGSPQWAAIAAILDQLSGGPLGNIAPELYFLGGTGSFHDIVHGSNTVYPPFASPGLGYHATPGFDAATGMGSPNVGVLINWI